MKLRLSLAACILIAVALAFGVIVLRDPSSAAAPATGPQVSINPALVSAAPQVVQKVQADRAAAEKAAAEQAWYAAAQAAAQQQWYEQVAINLQQEQAAAQSAARVQSRTPQTTARAPVAPSSAKQSGTGRCGGNLPPCSVMYCESGGSLTARNRSGAAGKWQIMPGTWNGYGGYSSADQAPESVQDERAAQIYAGGAGAGNWVCR